MWPEVYKWLQQRRLYVFLWGSLLLVTVTILMVQGEHFVDRAEEIQVKVLTQTMVKSAASIRQKWELENRPEYSSINGINYGFTQYGWPIIRSERGIDCSQTWNLLSSRNSELEYLNFERKSTVTSYSYDSCFYQISHGKWVALFYENETIRINGFLTHYEK